MSYKKVVRSAVVLWIFLCGVIMLAACAGEEKQGLETGKYVYAAKELASTGSEAVYDKTPGHSFPLDYKVKDDFLYYIYRQNGKVSLNRVKIDNGLDFGNGEKLLSSAYLRGYTLDREQNLYICTTDQGQVNLSAWTPEGEQLFGLSLEGDVPQSTGMTGCLAADGIGNVYMLVQNVIYRISIFDTGLFFLPGSF